VSKYQEITFSLHIFSCLQAQISTQYLLVWC